MQLINTAKLGSIHNRLVKRGETIAVAESVTTGLLQFALAQAESANEFFQGGITAYNLGQKYRHLKVAPIHAEACNCVSQKISEQMALNVCELFNSEWGIGTTGYATAVPESGDKIFAFFSIAYKGKVIARGKMSPAKDEASAIQKKYVVTIVDRLMKVLK
jgi:PncC family amidohydrolase